MLFLIISQIQKNKNIKINVFCIFMSIHPTAPCYSYLDENCPTNNNALLWHVCSSIPNKFLFVVFKKLLLKNKTPKKMTNKSKVG